MSEEMQEWGSNVRVAVKKVAGPGISIYFDDRDFCGSPFGVTRLTLGVAEAIAFACALKAFAEQPHQDGDSFTMEMDGEGWRGEPEADGGASNAAIL